MLGIGGALQNPHPFRLPDDKHKKTVEKIHASLSKEGGDVYQNEASSSTKEKKELDEKKQKRKELIKRKRLNDGSSKHLIDVILEGKEKMQADGIKNGVTFAMIGSSGCGKSTVIKKIFIDGLYGKEATKKHGEKKDYIIQIFTESAKSDAFKELGKDIIVDSKGLDVDNINFLYHMNEEYDKKYNFVVILDDVIKIKYIDLIERMFLTMRNTNITSLVSLQYPNLIPKTIRTSVYFTFLFMMNNDQGVELVVEGWLSSYLYGKTMREKKKEYLEWTLGPDKEGHQFFFRDNLNHRVYKVDSDYICTEMPLISVLPQEMRSSDYNTPPYAKRIKKEPSMDDKGEKEIDPQMDKDSNT